jgi:putative hydrolase of the HAD superfamily
MKYRAVIFDLGGVVLGSPLHAIADYERELGLPRNFVNQVVADTSPHGGWARLERGELSMEEFFVAFEADCRAAGGEISARTMMQRMGEATVPRVEMLGAIALIRDRGLRVAALTNNWATAESEESLDGTRGIEAHFDLFIESSVEGLRKPDPRIYQLTCERLGVKAEDCVFLDDIGSNLKSAKAMGIHTIKVIDPAQALSELASVLGFDLAVASTS